MSVHMPEFNRESMLNEIHDIVKNFMDTHGQRYIRYRIELYPDTPRNKDKNIMVVITPKGMVHGYNKTTGYYTTFENMSDVLLSILLDDLHEHKLMAFNETKKWSDEKFEHFFNRKK